MGLCPETLKPMNHQQAPKMSHGRMRITQGSIYLVLQSTFVISPVQNKSKAVPAFVCTYGLSVHQWSMGQ